MSTFHYGEMGSVGDRIGWGWKVDWESAVSGSSTHTSSHGTYVIRPLGRVDDAAVAVRQRHVEIQHAVQHRRLLLPQVGAHGSRWSSNGGVGGGWLLDVGCVMMMGLGSGVVYSPRRSKAPESMTPPPARCLFECGQWDGR